MDSASKRDSREDRLSLLNTSHPAENGVYDEACQPAKTHDENGAGLPLSQREEGA